MVSVNHSDLHFFKQFLYSESLKSSEFIISKLKRVFGFADVRVFDELLSERFFIGLTPEILFLRLDQFFACRLSSILILFSVKVSIYKLTLLKLVIRLQSMLYFLKSINNNCTFSCFLSILNTHLSYHSLVLYRKSLMSVDTERA